MNAINQNLLTNLKDNPERLSAKEIIEWGITKFKDKIAISCSFSMEDVIIIHIASEISNNIKIFAIDTGRLPEETFDVAEKIKKQFNLPIQWFFPKQEAVENLISSKGLFSFRESLENRHECCQIRKVEPLMRALQGLSAWITGLRRAQSSTRQKIAKIEMDTVHNNIYKLNPLADWSDEDVFAYTSLHNLPFNELYKKGYTSIGCAPCTRPTVFGEHPRAGRWWWESAEKKECGLHYDFFKGKEKEK